MNIPLSLFDSFNDVIYHDEPHHYYLGDKKLVSATTLLSNYHDKFDGEYWSEVKGKEWGITKEQVLRGWDFLSDFSQYKGSYSHNYAENLMNRKVFPYNKRDVVDFFGYDAIREEYELTVNQINNFYKDSLNKLVPLITEKVIYDPSIGLSGMIDLLAYNKKSGKIEIWDWKTSKIISKANKYRKMFSPIDHLDDCEFVHYSLQLNIYKYIINKVTGIDIGNCYLIWVNHANPNYEIIKCDDLMKEYEHIV